MGIVGMDHITINVLSMDSSMYFYEHILCLKKGSYVEMGDHNIQYFYVGETFLLELIEYELVTPTMIYAVNTKGIYRHIALKVDDIESFYNRIIVIDTNQNFIEITMPLSFCEKLGFMNFLIKDPNGIEIEILQRIE